EMGARGGMIGIDDVTIDYITSRVEVEQQAIDHWKSLNSNSDSDFDKVMAFNAKDIFPMITVGTSPDTGIFIDQQVKHSPFVSDLDLKYNGFALDDSATSIRVDYVFIGSCTNGRIEDIRAVAEVVKGQNKASDVVVWVVPGSQKVRQQAISEGLDKIIQEAGFEFRQPGCSACLAMNDDKIPEGAVCISTSNRNFEGRQGKGSITILASPATAAASAIAGKVTDPTKYLSK
ncbi:MAG: 3-isopropylmalate dehydratase large subunit, partial [Bacteroidia bacterium]|nr:3-isopropylmalate dehydratase large subunit [Bacteroidia bacterium]